MKVIGSETHGITPWDANAPAEMDVPLVEEYHSAIIRPKRREASFVPAWRK